MSIEIKTSTIFGKAYECKNTGFSGIAEGICKYENGCNRVYVQPKVKDDGSKSKGCWVDEPLLILKDGESDEKVITSIKTSIDFSKTYEDKNSGFRGVCVAIAKWQHGCIRITLRPKVNDSRDMPEEDGFDEESLINVKPIQKTTGGPALKTEQY